MRPYSIEARAKKVYEEQENVLLNAYYDACDRKIPYLIYFIRRVLRLTCGSGVGECVIIF